MSFSGGVRVGSVHIDGSGRVDIVTGAGVGGGPEVDIFDGLSGALRRTFFAFEPVFTGGVFVGG